MSISYNFQELCSNLLYRCSHSFTTYASHKITRSRTDHSLEVSELTLYYVYALQDHLRPKRLQLQGTYAHAVPLTCFATLVGEQKLSTIVV